MNRPRCIVYIVDDDESVRKSLKRLVKSAGFEVAAFATAQEFLDYTHPERPCCLVLDVRLPDLGGLDLQQEMVNSGLNIPIIFITGYGTVPMTVTAMKAGAVNFLEKPFKNNELLESIHHAIDGNVELREAENEIREIQSRYDLLTTREQEVLSYVITGMLNKQIASAMGISEKTIKVHRGRVMQKMQVVSVAELVRLAEKLGIAPPPEIP